MESVILVAPRPYDAEVHARLSQTWSVMNTPTGGLVIEVGGARVYVSRNDSVDA
jgi:hypothetical protein